MLFRSREGKLPRFPLQLMFHYSMPQVNGVYQTALTLTLKDIKVSFIFVIGIILSSSKVLDEPHEFVVSISESLDMLYFGVIMKKSMCEKANLVAVSPPPHYITSTDFAINRSSSLPILKGKIKCIQNSNIFILHIPDFGNMCLKRYILQWG